MTPEEEFAAGRVDAENMLTRLENGTDINHFASVFDGVNWYGNAAYSMLGEMEEAEDVEQAARLRGFLSRLV